MTVDVNAIFQAISQSTLFRLALELGSALGLPVTSWRVDDPTRATFQFTAEQLAARDLIVADFARSAFLSTAEGDWKTVVARETYGVPRAEAGYATPTVTVHNTGAGFYPREAGDLTFKASGINKTYHTTDAGTGGAVPGTIGPGETVVFNLIADEAGADSSTAIDDIDTLVTTLLGVEVVSSTAAVAQDAQDDVSLEDQCNDTLGALSPNGPDDAYEFVCKNSELTGNVEITRALTDGDDDTGHVEIYVAGPSGAVSGDAITAAQNAVEAWATPLCVRPTVHNCTGVPIDVTAELTGEDIPLDYLSKISIALAALYALPEMQGGIVARSKIDQVIHDAVPEVTSIALSVPAADVPLTISQVPTAGVLDITLAP